VNQRIKILCLGISRRIWKELQSQLVQELAIDEIELEFEYFGLKWSKLTDKAVHFIEDHQPDILFTSLENPKEVEGLVSFWEQIQDQQTTTKFFSVPYLFLLERKEDVIANNIEPLFLERPHEIIKDSEQIPDPFFNYYSNYEIKASSDAHLHDAFAGCLIIDGQQNLFPEVYALVDGKGNKEIQPSHVLLKSQFEQLTSNYQSFLNKFREQCKTIQSRAIVDKVSNEPQVIKQNSPLALHIDHTVVWKILSFLLNKDGYSIQKTTLANQEESSQRILRFGNRSFFKNPQQYSLPLPMAVQNVLGFDELKDDLTTFIMPPDEPLSSRKLSQKRIQLQEQIDSLQERHQRLNDAKKTQTQVEYLTMIGKRKLEIVAEIVNRSVPWGMEQLKEYLEHATPTLVLLRNREDEERFGHLIKTFDKHVSMNLSDLDDLKKLLKLKTDHIEDFVQNGIVISLESAKQDFASQIEGLIKELEAKEPPNLMESASEIWEQLIHYQKQLNDLGRNEIWKELEEYYYKINLSIYDWIKESYQKSITTRFQINQFKSITILAKDSETGTQLLSVLEELFSEQESSKISLISADLELNFDLQNKQNPEQEDINSWIDKNLNKIEDHFSKIQYELISQKIDLLICAHDLYFFQLLFAHLHANEQNSKIKETILLFSGLPDQHRINNLSLLGVRLEYMNALRIRDRDYLQCTLESLLE